MSGTFDATYGATAKRVFLGELFADEITYRVTATGVESTIRANIQEQVGALDPRQDQLFTISSQASDGIVSPVPGDLSALLARLTPAFAPFAPLDPDDYALSVKVNSRHGSARIVRAAYEFARAHRRRKVTIVHKANVVRAADGLFLEEARRVARDYPEIATDEANVDAICMWLLKNPLAYDVLVAPNLYGDIISDLCAQMVGGLGFGCSANIGHELAVFEPTHGSAPKYAGQYKVNPLATILAAKMMLDWLGEKELGAEVEAAVAAVVAEGRVRTYDMGGTATTLELGRAVAEQVPAAALR